MRQPQKTAAARRKRRRASRAIASSRTDTSSAEELLLRLLSIPGVSTREGPVMDFLCRTLAEAGVPKSAMRFDNAHRKSRHDGKVGNLVIRLPGTRRGVRRLLLAHTDTVPLCEGAEPARRGNRLISADPQRALGADDRAGTAVILHTLLEIVRRRLDHPPLTFLFTVQEELGLHGARHVQLGLLGRPGLAFNFDGSSPHQVTVGATGGYRLEVEITGIASHAGAAPEKGVSAIAIASLAIADLHHRGWHGAVSKSGRTGTSNVGVISGGSATNVVAPQVSVRAEARSHDPAFRRQMVREIQAAFRNAAKAVRNHQGRTGRVRFSGRLDYESFKLADDQPCVLAAEAAVQTAGRTPQRAISNGGLDANWITAHGIPTVSLGCGQHNAHTPREYLDLREFRFACQVALLLATGTEQ